MRPPTSSMSSDQHAVNGGHFNSSSASANSSLSSLPGNSSADAECGADYVKMVAETNGITNLSDQCASQVGASTTYVIKEVLEQAKKFAAHGRRRRLLAEDFDSALAFKGYPPLFGFTSKEGIPFRLVGSTGRDLFVTDDRDIDLASIVNAPPAKVPLETSVKAHWLVIDGEQPAVPENPTPVLEEDATTSTVTERMDTSEHGPTILSQAAKTVRKTEQVQIKTITTHALSVEQQIFFKEITEAIMGSDDARRTEALHSLQTDAGIQVLLPRFSLAIAEGVRCNIVHHNLAILIYLMRMIQSLASNPALCLDRCLHELLPSILSCILSKQLCARPDTDNHWALREFSSRLLSTICRAYNVNGLRSRITQVLTRVWRDENSTLSTLYGSVYALNELGIDTIRAVVVPRAPELYNEIKKSLSEKSNAADKIAADKTQSFVTKVLINYVRTQRPSGLKDVNDYRSMFGGFGDAIFRAISIEMTHTSSMPVGISSSLSSSSTSSTGSSMQRSISDRRSLGPTSSQQQQRLSMASTKQDVATRFTTRTQGSQPIRHQSLQQPYVNLSTGNRLQPAGPSQPRSASPASLCLSGTSSTSAGSFVVRPSSVKKLVVSSGQQRFPGGSSGPSYRNT